MIVVRLMGGLGNQLFQWAYGKHLSLTGNRNLYMDLSFLNSYIPGVTKRSYSLNKFPNFSEKLTDEIVGNSRPFDVVADVTDLDALNPEKNYILIDHFQKERFFKGSEAVIRHTLSPPADLAERFGITTNSVSMHIRRTDYVTSNGFHPVQDLEYYTQALCELEAYDKLFVFSDDPSWCRENLPFENMTVVTGNDEVVDLWLMSLCRDNIIANSSFSWWGAWLNSNTGKKVVYPKKWYGGHEADIACSEWIAI